MLTTKFNASIGNDILKEKLCEIRDYLRENGVGLGMNALKTFNVIYFLKKIEENDVLFKELFKPTLEEEAKGININTYRFTELAKLAKSGKKENLEILQVRILRKILDKMADNEILRKIVFYEIPKDMNLTVYSDLVLKINDLNNDFNGKIYENFVGVGKDVATEVGAYFTDEHIIKHIFNLVKPSLNSDNTVKSFIDPFGVSYSFSYEYIKYLKENNLNINWKNEIDKIYHFDTNEDIIKTGELELLYLTGYLSDCGLNFRKINSFKYDFDEKYDYVISTAPFGGDKVTKSVKQQFNEKLIEHINNELRLKKITLNNTISEQLRSLELENINETEEQKKQIVSKDTCSNFIKDFCVKHGLDPKDREGCSLILMMNLLNNDGTCVTLLKDGVLFDKKYRLIRKVLIENYNVLKIISIPVGEFKNTTTSTKTSIIIFKNTVEKTSSISFYDLIVNKEKEDVFVIKDGKYELKHVKDMILSIDNNYICSANINDIIKNDYLLDGKKYNNENILQCNEGFKFIKMNELIEYYPLSKRNNTFGQDIGEYNFYMSKEDVMKCDEADYHEELLLISKSSNRYMFIASNFSCSNTMLIIKPKINIRYLYFILKILFDKTGKMSISKEYLNNIDIPIPDEHDKINYWSLKICTPYDTFIYSKIDIEKIENDIKNEINRICNEEECEYKLIEEICNIERGKHFSRKETTSGIYDVYGGGEKYCTHNIYNREGFNILISRVGVSKNCVRLMNEKFYLTENGITINFKDKNKNFHLYIGYYLFNKQEEISKLAQGSVQKALNIEVFNKYIVKIPINKSLINNLQLLFDKLEYLNNIIKNNEEEYKQNMNELCSISFKNFKTTEKIVNEDDNISLLTTSTILSEHTANTAKSCEKILCTAIVKSTGLKCTKEGKYNGLCGVHKPKNV